MAPPAPGPLDARALVGLVVAFRGAGDAKDACIVRLIAWYEALAGEIAK